MDLPLVNSSLYVDRTPGRLESTVELEEKAVTGRFDLSVVVSREEWVDGCLSVVE
jgi:hypothetical protein